MPCLDARGVPDRLGAMVMCVVDARRWEAVKPHLPSALLWLKDHVYILAEPQPGAQVEAFIRLMATALLCSAAEG